VLHLVGGADTVALLDFDQELLAPRYRAAEQALALVVRAARLLGGRRGRGGRLLLQTRLPDHEVVDAARLGDPARVSEAEAKRREQLGFPPDVAMATVSGPAAPAFLDGFGAPLGVEVLGPSDGTWVLRAADHPVLCDALAATERPAGRVRVEVDPLRI
jgi:primosomal protein N' (replication factor Y) (superfamily II helicase)